MQVFAITMIIVYNREEFLTTIYLKNKVSVIARRVLFPTKQSLMQFYRKFRVRLLRSARNDGGGGVFEITLVERMCYYINKFYERNLKVNSPHGSVVQKE